MTRLPFYDSSIGFHVCSSLTFQPAMRVLPFVAAKGKAILRNLDFVACCLQTRHNHLFPIVNLASKAVRIT